MAKKKTKLQLAQEKAEATIKKTNEKIDELGKHTGELYDSLNEIQSLFDEIRGVPGEEIIRYQEIKAVRLNWKEQVALIETEYKHTVAQNAGKGAAGAGVGVAAAALGPSAAMGVATTFGVASTGTAISSLSGAAATNAALAWLGGGALAAEGGGMAAGGALLGLFGPVGVAIAGIALLGSGFVLLKTTKDKKALEDIFVAISNRDIKKYQLAIVELNERIRRIKSETEILKDAIKRTKELGSAYDEMTEDEQYELIGYVNLMNSSTQLLVNPVLGLQPKYTEDDFNEFLLKASRKRHMMAYINRQHQIITLANMFYGIMLSGKEKQLIHKSLRDNKELRHALKLSKKEFNYDIMDMTIEVLKYQRALNDDEEKLFEDDNEYVCPNCGAVLNDQDGFSPDAGTWICTECNTQLLDEDVEGDVFEDVVWYCDSCGTVLNTQKGFTEKQGVWKCDKCGFENSITEDDIKGVKGKEQKKGDHDMGKKKSAIKIITDKAKDVIDDIGDIADDIVDDIKDGEAVDKITDGVKKGVRAATGEVKKGVGKVTGAGHKTYKNEMKNGPKRTNNQKPQGKQQKIDADELSNEEESYIGNWAQATVELVKQKLLAEPIEGMKLGVSENDDGSEILHVILPTEECGEMTALLMSNEELSVTLGIERFVVFPKNISRELALQKANEFNRKLLFFTYILIDDDEPYIRVKSSFMCSEPDVTSDEIIAMVSMLNVYCAEAYAEFTGLYDESDAK